MKPPLSPKPRGARKPEAVACICAGPGHFIGEGCGVAVKDGLCQACIDECCFGPSLGSTRACARCNAEYMRPVGDECPMCGSLQWRELARSLPSRRKSAR